MKVTYLEHMELSGPFREFRLEWPELTDGAVPPEPLDFRPNFNQRNHLAAFRATGRSTWIGGTVRLPDDLATDDDVAVLVRSLVDGADALRTVAGTGEGTVTSPGRHRVLPSGVLRVIPGELRDDPPEDLGRRIDSRCLPGPAPALFFARAGDRLVFAADHFHADMMSVELLADRVRGAGPGDVGFLETLADDEAEVASAGEETALDTWRRFFAVTGGRVPGFPVDLGVAGTGPVTPVHDVRRVADAHEVTGDLGARTFAVLLSALAGAVEPFTGADGFPVLVPVHTRGRRTDPRRRTVGWMVSNAPVIAEADDPDATAGWLRDAVRVAELPLERMVDTLRPVLPRGAVPMVSYVDFRRPGSPEQDTTYFSSVSPTDTVQFWFSRRQSGIDLRTKYPDTPRAREVVGGILSTLRSHVTGTVRY